MKVQIIATRQCSHRPNLERELKDLGVDYEVLYVEEHPEVVARLGIRHSPNLVVDECLVYQGQPSEYEIRRILNLE